MLGISTALLCFLLFGTPLAANLDTSDWFKIDDLQANVEKRGIGHHKNLKIGMFQPLICEGFYKKYKSRREARSITKDSKLGFFTPIYCKHLNRWLNNNKHDGRSFGKDNCQRKNSDCYEILQCLKSHGQKAKSRVYTIKPSHYKPIQVYCDMETDGGGWTVFQQRKNGNEKFFRTWYEYQNGFGNLREEFWLGNDHIHAILAQGKYVLRIRMMDNTGIKRFAYYKKFKIGNEGNKYKLSIGEYSGNAGDNMAYHNNAYFSTKDHDNDDTKRHCAVLSFGAWWYKGSRCNRSNLNGSFSKKRKMEIRSKIWKSWPKRKTYMKSSQLAVRWQRAFKY